ncbi:ImmA/IrrE family metallo-endopeptidase [Granulicella cerasi]|uniref:ImmA/IrrE family metallo-endopeptidase n=1 Tax=Granulicella cerasi TaxID=741063 RepID=A0ABW1Z9I2_9BACT|nr:ImmA/IrrE family metallo-endopeptidase [Granulicella cerasi]
MPDRRDIILEATLEAERLHKQLGTKRRLQEASGAIDVFGTIVHSDVALLFKRLDGLLGAFMQKPSPGIIITTERPLAIQRFTAAHELGHWYLKHSASLDDESILHRSPYVDNAYDNMELAADTFAASFLMPEWAVNYHAERQGWNWQTLANPVTTYQLSLRLGVSYEACARVLRRNGLVDQTTLNGLLNVQPKQIKQRLLEGHSVANWYPNIWRLTEKDQGTTIVGEPNDVFIVRLKENSGAGYLWNLDQVREAGFHIVADERKPMDLPGEVGGPVTRVLTAQSEEPITGAIHATESRPWNPSDQTMSFSFTYDLRGKEHGLPRALRGLFEAA